MRYLQKIGASFIKFIAVYFAPIIPLLLMIGLSIFIDTFFGIKKAKKIGEQITSKRLRCMINKMLIYNITIIFFFFIDKSLLNEFVVNFFSINYLFTKISALSIIFVEYKSINEKLEVLYNINITDKLKELITNISKVKEKTDEFRN
jgi:hypothetical protein